MTKITIKSKIEIINTIKLLLYKENPGVFEKLNFDDDEIFLEPLLFAYFNSKSYNLYPREAVEEVLQGYFLKKDTIQKKHSFNRNNIAYIHQVGYFKKGRNHPYESILIEENFELVKEIHPTQGRYFVESYLGHIVNQNPIHNSVWKEHYRELFKAINIIKKNLPNFYAELTFANKKIYLHDNSKILNFTSVETLGMLYFYVIKKNNLIYFIEELIHQGSHNYLYYVLHHKTDYFKIDVENLVMRDFTKQQWDYRTIYGAFHGLFTVTQRVNCFDKLLTQNVFSGREKHELLGRLTDQFSRFRTGLELLDFDKIYTEKGIAFYTGLDSKCNSILKKHSKLTDEFDLSNRDIDFKYEDFCKLNPYEKFLKKDENNYYQF